MDLLTATAAGAAAPTSNPAPGSAAQAGKDQFLALLVAQISHQDPLNPMDDKDMVTQLAQFTGVEQAIETNTRLAALQTAITGQTHTALTNIIGKDITAQGDVVRWDGSGLPANVPFTLHGEAEHVVVSIVDAQGRLVNAIDVGAMGAGSRSITWDGRGAHGEPLPPGEYRVRVDAVDAHKDRVAADSTISGRVSGIVFTPSGPEMLVGNARVRAADIVEIKSAL